MDSKNAVKKERTLLEGIIYLLSILWKYRLMIVIATGAITLATIVFCAISIVLPASKSPLPDKYKAEATIIVQENNTSDIAGSIVSALGITQGAAGSMRDNGDLIVEILRSRGLLDRLVSEFRISERYHIENNVKGNSRQAILDRMGLSYATNTGALRISYEDIDPEFCKNIVNEMVRLLEEWFNQNRGLAKQKQKQSLEDKLAEVRTSIETLQNRLKSLQKQYGVLNVQELGESQAASIANLRSQLILKDVEIKNYTSFSKIDDPRLEQLKEERQNLLDLIAQNQQKLPESQMSVGGGMKSLPDVAQDFTQLTLELDIQQRIYNTLSPQYEAAKLAPESDPIFQILEMADIPDIKSGPKRTNLIMIAFIGSLFASIGVSLLLHALRNLNAAKLKQEITHFS